MMVAPKGAIIVNIPNECPGCPNLYLDTRKKWACRQYGHITDLWQRPRDCPIRPIPEKREMIDPYDMGWNDCVDLILGGAYNGS